MVSFSIALKGIKPEDFYHEKAEDDHSKANLFGGL